MSKEYLKCFACGVENQIGLKLKFTYNNEIAESNFILSPDYCGYPNIIHGGIVATILDEVMAKVIINTGIEAVTHDMNVVYKKSLHPNKNYKAVAEILEVKRRIIKSKSAILDVDGNIIASAEARYFRI
jgi:uncharacterized protein (TIGR00369 family)